MLHGRDDPHDKPHDCDDLHVGATYPLVVVGDGRSWRLADADGGGASEADHSWLLPTIQ